MVAEARTPLPVRACGPCLIEQSHDGQREASAAATVFCGTPVCMAHARAQAHVMLAMADAIGIALNPHLPPSGPVARWRPCLLCAVAIDDGALDLDEPLPSADWITGLIYCYPHERMLSEITYAHIAEAGIRVDRR